MDGGAVQSAYFNGPVLPDLSPFIGVRALLPAGAQPVDVHSLPVWDGRSFLLSTGPPARPTDATPTEPAVSNSPTDVAAYPVPSSIRFQPPSPFSLPPRRFRDISLSDWSQPALSAISRSPIHWESVMELAELMPAPPPEESPLVGVELEELESECSLLQPPATRNPLLPRFCPLGLEIPPPRLEWLISQGLQEPRSLSPCSRDLESGV